jgi:hypothetical protein
LKIEILLPERAEFELATEPEPLFPIALLPLLALAPFLGVAPEVLAP